MKSYDSTAVAVQPDKLLRISAIISLICIAISTIIISLIGYGIYHYDVIHFMDSLQVFLQCPKK